MSSLEIQSKVIQWMRFPLAVAIVFLHCSSSPFDGDIVYSFVRQYISVTLVGVAVPIFFLISGFLFFLNVEQFSKQIYFNKLKNRVRSLLLPYVLWNIIAALIPFLILSAIVVKNAEPVQWLLDYLQGLNGWHMFWDYNHWNECGSGPIDLPLWFIRDLMVICLITPLIYFFIKKLDWLFLLIVGALYLLSYWQYFYFNTRAILFFSLGAYLAIRRINIVDISRKFASWLFLIALFLSALLTVYKTTAPLYEWAYQCFVIIFLLVLIQIGDLLIKNGRGNLFLHFSQTSFFIYAVHEIKVAEVCEQISNRLFPEQDTFSLILHYFFYPILGIGLCVLLYFSMKAVAPRLLFLLTGNRTGY